MFHGMTTNSGDGRLVIRLRGGDRRVQTGALGFYGRSLSMSWEC
jgi:hypothetical protein